MNQVMESGSQDQLERSVALNKYEQDRCLRWWLGRFIRELPPLTVEAPACGTYVA
jgi:hypothetical protein